MPQTQKALAPELEAFIVTKGERSPLSPRERT